jgi:[ribosomal protein S5]-alanine N-acetyltransferase
MTVLHTPSVTLRPWRSTDAEALVRHANDRRIWKNLRDRFPHPYGRADAEGWIAFATSQVPPLRYFALTLNDEPIGSVGLDAFDDVHRYTAELGYWIGAAHWGRGYATDAAIAMTAYGFAELGLERIQAGVYEWNPASERVLVKAGFQLEGRLRRHASKDGVFGDVLMYATVRVPRA